MRILIAIIALTLAGCGGGGGAGGDSFTPGGEIPKTLFSEGEIRATNRVESVPLVVNGELREYISARTPLDHGHGDIEQWDDQAVTSSFPSSLMLPCLVEDQGDVYVFGVGASGSGEWRVMKALSNDPIDSAMKQPEPTVALHALPGEGIFNSSVTRAPDGSWVAAIEVNGLGEPFSTRFATAPNLYGPWEWSTATFGVNEYAACPCIRYAGGMWMLFVLRRYSWGYGTTVSVADDLHGPWKERLILAPGEGEGVNASDPEIVVHDGATYLYYADGDQQTWANIRRVRIPGSLDSFAAQLAGM
jgi:hypothetical protein